MLLGTSLAANSIFQESFMNQALIYLENWYMHVEKHILAYRWIHDQHNYLFIPSETYLIYFVFNYPFFSWLMLLWLDRESPVFICMDLLCALPQLLPELWSQSFKEYFCLLKGNFLLMAIQSQIFFQTCHEALYITLTGRSWTLWIYCFIWPQLLSCCWFQQPLLWNLIPWV